MTSLPSVLRSLLPKSIVILGLFASVGLVGCGKPVAQQNELTPESKEELRAQLKERAAREQKGL